MKITTLFYNKKRFLFYLLIISITPAIIYGVLQGSNSIAVTQLNDVHQQIETDFEVQFGETDYVYDYIRLQQNYETHEILGDKVTIIMGGQFDVNLANASVTIYFCEFDDFFTTPRYTTRFPSLEAIDKTNYTENSVYMNQNALNVLNLSIHQNFSLSGYSTIGNKFVSMAGLNVKDEFNPQKVLRQKSYYGTWNVKKKYDFGSLFSLDEASFFAENVILMDFSLIEDQVKPQLGNLFQNFIKMNILFQPLEDFGNFQEWRRDLAETQQVFERFLIPLINANEQITQRYYLQNNFQIIENSMQIFKMFTILIFLPILIFTWIITSSMNNSALNNDLMNLRLEYVRGWSKTKIFTRIYFENFLIMVASLPVMISLGEIIRLLMVQIYTTQSHEIFNVSGFLLGIFDYLDKISIIIGINLVVFWLLLYFNLRKVDIIFQKDFSFKNFHELPVNIHQRISITNRNPLLKAILLIISILIPVGFIIFRSTLQVRLSSLSAVFSALEVLTIILLLFNPIAIIYLFANDFSRLIFNVVKKFIYKIKSTEVHFNSFINFRNNKVQLFALIFMMSMVLSHFIMSDILYQDVEKRNLEHSFDVNGANARLEVPSGLLGGYDNPINDSVHSLLEDHNSTCIEIIEDFSYFFYTITSRGQTAIFNKRIQLNLLDSSSYLSHLAENEDKLYDNSVISIFEPIKEENNTIISSYLMDNYGIAQGNYIIIKSGDLNYSLRVAGVYSQEDPPLPGIMLDSASTIFLDNRHPLMQNISLLNNKLNKQIYLFPNITDSMQDEIKNGFIGDTESNSSVNSVNFGFTTLEDIQSNLQNPVFDFALYPVLVNFIRLESLFVLIFLGIGILSFINNLFYQNVDSLLLALVRGKDQKSIFNFSLRLTSLVSGVVFFLSILGFYNGYLLFEIFSKSEISMIYNPVAKGLNISGSNILLALLLFGGLFILINIICYIFLKLYTKNPQNKLKWLKRE